MLQGPAANLATLFWKDESGALTRRTAPDIPFSATRQNAA
jgi:hypothetical protein